MDHLLQGIGITAPLYANELEDVRAPLCLYVCMWCAWVLMGRWVGPGHREEYCFHFVMDGSLTGAATINAKSAQRKKNVGEGSRERDGSA